MNVHEVVRRRGALVIALLLIIAVGLIAVSFVTGSRTAGVSPMPNIPPRPSPSWGPLPTRAPGVSVAPLPTVSDLWGLHRALLRGDIAIAQSIWESEVEPMLQEVAPGLDASSGDPEVIDFVATGQRAGARLALMQDDLDAAEVRIWDALRAAPRDAEAWSLLGITFRRAGKFSAAQRALAIAETLDPDRAPELFDDRWRTALLAEDVATMVALAEDYTLRYPDSRLASYYRAEALLATDQALAAIEALVPSVQEPPTAPALLWYTLGRAYLARGGFRESATALEVSALRVAHGDHTLGLVTDDPILALNIQLGKAYFGMGRCPEAEGIFRRISVGQPEFEAWIEQAVACQTPTPTLTPWMPVMTPFP
jgi:Flp pilus assembly protein TadD